ncbi:MAG: isocitrate dehydrogenase [Phycisphaeraceae bacterium]|nr:isocitrate dehydrogenase [Phycisphaeraceae bacterium]
MRIAIAPGDGIGPEIMDVVLAIFKAAGVNESIEFLPAEMGEAVFDKGITRGMTDEAVSTVESCGLLYKGPMGTPKGGGGKSINVTARKMWGAFANLRHFRTLPGVDTVYSRAGQEINMYVVRENVEDTYGGIEHRLTNDVTQCLRLISAPGCDQVCRFAFDTAKKLGLTRIHCGHKANIMKLTDGMFLERFREIARTENEIVSEDVIVDALCMNLVMRPAQFQMVVLTNLQGDIVSDLCAGLVGGLGFAPSANIGEHIGIFEAVHGTAPDIAGRGIANPTSLLLSGLMMLRHVGLVRTAAIIENALLATLEAGVHTGDFGDKNTPSVGTMDFAGEIIDRIGAKPDSTPVRVPSQDVPQFSPPSQPSKLRMMRANDTGERAMTGADVYVQTMKLPSDVAEAVKTVCQGSKFDLSMISNRGTQVWPTGSLYTECVDHSCLRFAARDNGTITQNDVLKLAEQIGTVCPVVSVVPLQHFDGQRGYSLAQGQ